MAAMSGSDGEGEGGVDGNGDDGGVMTTTGAAVAGGANSLRAVTAGSVDYHLGRGNFGSEGGGGCGHGGGR